jgi:Fe2+ or Zn2+ uptake regulation protein
MDTVDNLVEKFKHHIICSRCNKISDIKKEYVQPRLPKELLNEFTPSSYHISFYSMYKKCQ